MIALGTHPEGSLLPVRAQPGARRTGVVGEHDGALKVAVAASARDGRANQALLEVLRQALRLKRAQLELIQGATDRRKTFLVRGLAKADLESRLARLC